MKNKLMVTKGVREDRDKLEVWVTYTHNYI